MEDCDVQLNETVSNTGSSYLYNDIGKLILEELRCFRKEMKEEVQKLNMNVQNFLFSKADVVNALLGSSALFNEIDQSLSKAFDEKPKYVNDPLQQVQQKKESLQSSIKFQPVPVKYTKYLTDPISQTLSNSKNAAEQLSYTCSTVAGAETACDKAVSGNAKQRMAKILSEFNSDTKSDDAPDQMEVQVLQYNGESSLVKMHETSNSGNKGESYEMRKKRIKLGSSSLVFSPTILPSNKSNLYKSKYLSESDLGKQPSMFPYIAPKVPSKYTQIMNKLKTYHGMEKPSLPKKLARTFRCKFCERVFLSSNDLKRHIRLHTGDRPFKCKQCPKTYTRNDHLRRHMKQKHKTDILTADNSNNSKSVLSSLDETAVSMLDETTGMINSDEANTGILATSVRNPNETSANT